MGSHITQFFSWKNKGVKQHKYNAREYKKMNAERLELLKTRVECMDKKQHVEILRILKTSSLVQLNENKSGIFVNLSFLPENILSQIEEYIKYVDDQETTLSGVEKIKEMYKTEYITDKDIKEENTIGIST